MALRGGFLSNREAAPVEGATIGFVPDWGPPQAEKPPPGAELYGKSVIRNARAACRRPVWPGLAFAAGAASSQRNKRQISPFSDGHHSGFAPGRVTLTLSGASAQLGNGPGQANCHNRCDRDRSLREVRLAAALIGNHLYSHVAARV